MNIYKNVLILILSVFLISIVILFIITKKPFKTLFLNAFIGVCTLAILDLTSKITGVYIPINTYTVTGASIFGIPAICGFLLLKILFI
ncbi:MAG: pro-sigmaK processing inhibitor BofA family protein [Clostridia bacterium]|nr:pro-sigmaK processing inhibitor BofA family protein [Clostridia bacterium]